jgi:hypothetical protein
MLEYQLKIYNTNWKYRIQIESYTIQIENYRIKMEILLYKLKI